MNNTIKKINNGKDFEVIYPKTNTMLVTKEHQEAILNHYTKKDRTMAECVAFLDGMKAMLDYVELLSKKS